MEPFNKLLRIRKAWFAETVIKRLALFIERLKKISPDNQNVVRLDGMALSLCACLKIYMSECLTFIQHALTTMPSHIQ
ncbi:hypothetical protein D3C78_1395490 [compost metagenome]